MKDESRKTLLIHPSSFILHPSDRGGAAMSHGAGGDGGIRAEPDLTPMLDLVMQLLMYFIMCANFIGEEVPENIHLPSSQAAKPLTRENDILFMNINREGKVLVLGQEPMNMEDTTKWLNDRVMEAPKDDK